MSKYKLLENGGVFDSELQISIPPIVGNRYWDIYQQWLLDDPIVNIPDPYIEHIDEIGQVNAEIYTESGEIREHDISRTYSAITNGDFNISQRNTSFINVLDKTYTLDHWMFEKSGNMEYSIVQDSDVPTYSESKHHSQYSLKAQCTHSATPASDNYVRITHPIEGIMAAPYVNQPNTISFWVKTSLAGTYCLVVSDGIQATFVAEYEVSVANVWERIVLFIPPTPPIEYWNFNNTLGFNMHFILTCSAQCYTTTPNMWQGILAYGTESQVEHSAITDATFSISQVQVDPGYGSIAYVGKQYVDELALCQRYYETSYSLTYPLQSNTVYNIEKLSSNLTEESGYISHSINFSTEKRVAPTMRYFDDLGTTSRITGWTTNNTKVSNIEATDIYPVAHTKRFSMNIYNEVAYNTFGFHWEANSEL